MTIKAFVKMLLLGGAFTLLLVVTIAIFNPVYSEAGEGPVIAPLLWNDWGLPVSAALLIVFSILVGLYVRNRSFRLKTRTLERKVSSLEKDLAELTERLREAEKNAGDFQRRAEIASQARDVFLSKMSHELCTPLNGILGYANILRRNPELDSSIADGLDIILRSGEHLQALINDLLDLVRISAGKLVLYPEPIQLSSFTDHVQRLIKPKADNKGLALTVSILPGLPNTVMADETRLRQVLLHLLDNAVKFTDQGEVALIIEALNGIGPRSTDVNLRFTVVDSGVGMAPNQLEQVFLPFEERANNPVGAGVGLIVSQNIIQKMGGELHAKSTEGGGSHFWFDVTLPVVEGGNRELQKPIHAVRGYEGERRKILVVDDKPYNRLLLKAMLEPLGFEVAMAEDGQQAVERTIAWRPDVILLDLVMPVKSGFEAVRDIRQHPDLKEVFIVAVSASVSDAGREQSMEVGCNAYLSKPVSLGKLLTTLAELLELTWIYTDTVAEKESALIAPPIEDLILLQQLAEEGQVYEIQKYAIQLEGRDEVYMPFCRQLKTLARGFEMEQIAELVKRFSG